MRASASFSKHEEIAKGARSGHRAPALDRAAADRSSRSIAPPGQDGTHDALIKTGGRYARLHRLQGGIYEVG
jgi:hypothetical protein